MGFATGLVKMFVRRATEDDVPNILSVHSAAVRRTAAAVYDQTIIETWAAKVTPEAISGLQDRIASGEEVVFVAEENGKIAGFGGKLFDVLQATAKELGLPELQMDASLNAEAFYVQQGFEIVSYGEHPLRAGLTMPCVKMRKSLQP